MEDTTFKILFVHPNMDDCDKIRRTLIDEEECEVEVAGSIKKAKSLLEEYSYNMLILNRKFNSESFSEFLSYIEENFKDMECVIGVQKLSKADLIHYQNHAKKYRLYLEPVDYTKEILPMVQNEILLSKIKNMDALFKRSIEREDIFKKDIDVMISLIDIKGEFPKRAQDYYKRILTMYHDIAISNSNIENLSDIESEIKSLSKLFLKADIKWIKDDKELRNFLSKKEKGEKRFNLAIIASILVNEAIELSAKEEDNSVNVELNPMLHDNGILLSTTERVPVDNLFATKKMPMCIDTTNLLLKHFSIDYSARISRNEKFLEIKRDVLL